MPYHGFSMTAPGSLLNAFEKQDQVLAPAFSILQEAITQQAFPAASIAITHQGRLVALKALGHFTYKVGAPLLASVARSGNYSVNPSTLFDLASLTKAVATTPMAMLLYERGLLDLDAPVSAIVPEFTHDPGKDSRRHEVTLRMLLAHSSGLPAYEKLFLKAPTRDQLLQAAFITPLAADPATRANYSDIGFIILGIALERLADEPIDRFCQREIFAPLSMTNTTFNPPPEIRGQIPATANDQTFRQRLIQGEVQDENVSIMGGVAAHAGLFSTAQDLAKFAHAMLNGGHPILRPETVSLFTRRESTPPGTSRALGWDTPSTPSQSGKYFSPDSTATSATLGPLSGSTPGANSQSRSSPTAPGPTAPTKPSNKSAQDSTTQ